MAATSTSQRNKNLVLIVCLASATFAAAQVSSPAQDESWNATSETVISNANPFRTAESHVKSENRTVEKKTVEVLGPDGRYQPYFEVERETIQESPTVTRRITRTYNPDADGHKQLTQIIEAETQTSDGVTRTVQTMSTNAYEERFHVAERQIIVTTKGSESQKTQTTVYQPSVNGDLAPTVRIDEQQKQDPNGNIETKKGTLLPDGGGRWQVYEVRDQTITGDAGNRTTDERTSRRDAEGNVSPVSQVITKDTNVNGQLTSNTENYSVDVLGYTRDQKLHPVQTSTTVRTTEPDRVVTEQQVLSPGSGWKDVDTLVTTEDVLTTGSSGSEETITVTARYPGGYPAVVSLETRKSDRAIVKKEGEY
jgi:hypothetical protein